jgi:hypothetical protein
MKIAGLFPSRGLLGSQMMESVDANLEGYDHVKIYSHDLPIPESFNSLVEDFLQTDSDYAWFVEEDVVPPASALDLMLSAEVAVAFVDYPLKNFPNRPCYGTYRGRLIWVGFGCTLVHRAVFTTLKKPWFETQWKYVAVHSGSAQAEPEIKIIEDPFRPYGGQDLFFCHNAIKAGFAIQVMMGLRCKHPVPVNVTPVKDSVETNYDQETPKEINASLEPKQPLSKSAVLR